MGYCVHDLCWNRLVRNDGKVQEMKWAIYNPKTNLYVHPSVYKDPLTNIEWNFIEWSSLPYFFADNYEMSTYLRGVDENGNECVQLEGCLYICLYMMCMENRP